MLKKMTKKTNVIAKCILFLVSAHSVLGDSKCPALEEEPWSYEGRTNGPDKWGETYPMCNGQQQSPIDIKIYSAKKDRSVQKLNLVNYDIPVKQSEIVNNGHTVKITPRDGVQRYIQINGTNFQLQQFHFHWRANKRRSGGTEHAYNGHQYAMEVHFVHSSDQNKIAVVGVLHRASLRSNRALKPIIHELFYVQYKNDRSTISADINLNDLLPSNPSSFYRYMGSFTTPPCTEGVTWTLLDKVHYIGEDQLEAFFDLYAVPRDSVPEDDKGECKIINNVRPLQDINGRRVFASH